MKMFWSKYCSVSVRDMRSTIWSQKIATLKENGPSCEKMYKDMNVGVWSERAKNYNCFYDIEWKYSLTMKQEMSKQNMMENKSKGFSHVNIIKLLLSGEARYIIVSIDLYCMCC